MSIKGATYVKEHGANAGLDLIEVPDDVLEILGAGEEPEPVEEEAKENVDKSASETVPEQGAEEADAEEEASEEGEVLEKKPPTRKEKRIEQLVYERKQAEERAAAEAAARDLDRQRIQELEARLQEVQKGRSEGSRR
jgi:flagellar biosynthesis GTPase FlhF